MTISRIVLMAVLALALGACTSKDGSAGEAESSTEGVAQVSTEERAAERYTQAVESDDPVQARYWGSRALAAHFPPGSSGGLEVDADMFGPLPVDDSSIMSFDSSILVRTAQIEQARAALKASARRFMMVTISGAEYPSFDAMDAAEQGPDWGPEDDTPSYVSDVEEKADGVAVVIDTEWMHFGMKVKLLEIVLDELQAAGVEQATIMSDPM